MSACRWCSAPAPEVVLDLGRQPPADLFPHAGEPVPTFPLRLGVCGRCGLAQLLEDPGVREQALGIEPQALLDQAIDAVDTVTAAGLVGPGVRIAEFDSPHGGSWRGLLRAAGAVDVTGTGGPAELVVDVFGLMHDADQRAALTERVGRLAPGGTLALQYQPLGGIVAGGQWNAVRHGHMAYYDDPVLVAMLGELGLVAGRSWTFPLYGGTTLLTATVEANGPTAPTPGPRVDPRPLAQVADRAAAALRVWLTAQRDAGRTVVGYGAASRTTPLLVHAGVGPDLLPVVVDAAAGKWGRVIPGVGVPVVAPAELDTRRPDVVLLFVPDLLAEVRRAYPQVEASGAAWAVGDPDVRIAHRDG